MKREHQLRSRWRNGPVRPDLQLFGIFQDIDRHFVIMFEELLAVRAKRLHTARGVRRLCGPICFQVESAFVNDAKERLALVETMPAEHRFATELGDLAELIQDKIFETVGTHAPRTFRCSPVDVDRSSMAA